jgi:hypothetical protein
VSLFSANDVATGRVIGKCHNRHREEEFLKFMNLVDSQLPAETQIYIVLDKSCHSQNSSGAQLVCSTPTLRVAFYSYG